MASNALARPPFAVDDQDTQYLDHRRQPRRPREERNKVSDSTYNAYDNYLDQADSNNPNRGGANLAAPSNNTLHRSTPSTASDAHGAIGDGLLAALADDDSDFSDSEEPQPSPSRTNPAPNPAMIKSKNQALFEAAVGGNPDRSPSPRGPPPPAYDDSDRKRYPVEKGGGGAPHGMIPPRDVSPNLQPHQGKADRMAPSPTPSITPPPAAPVQVQIHTNAPQPTRPIPAAGNRAGPPGLSINPPHPSAFQHGPPMFGGSPMPGSATPYGSPAFPMTPTQIPTSNSTPIQPVFIQPIKPAFIKADGDNEKSSSVLSHESAMPILRGDKEDSLPLRSGRRIPRVGEKMGKDGDQFWRRFSMVVKAEKTTPATKKKSEWLEKHQRGTRVHRRWAMCFGVFLLAGIIGAAVTGWWFTRNNPDHQVPETLGEDSAHHTMGDTTTAIPTPVSGKKTTSAAAAHKTATADDNATAKRIKRMVEEAQDLHLDQRSSSDVKDVAGSSKRRRGHAKRTRHLNSQAQVERSS
ncbi:hypothetical protein FRB90_004077 [Tulasnella sp. 427]|nr:hypothetical protein FRB90_004077 [Tulasnella sp. 427]